MIKWIINKNFKKSIKNKRTIQNDTYPLFEVLWKCEFACSVKKSKEESGAVNCGRDAAVSMIIICCCNSKMNMNAISPLLVKTTETMANDCQVMNNHDSEIVKAQISANRFCAKSLRNEMFHRNTNIAQGGVTFKLILLGLIIHNNCTKHFERNLTETFHVIKRTNR